MFFKNVVLLNNQIMQKNIFNSLSTFEVMIVFITLKEPSSAAEQLLIVK